MKITIEIVYTSPTQDEPGYWDANYMFHEDGFSDHMLPTYESKEKAFEAVVEVLREEITL